MSAMFMRHEGYLGAIGAFFRNQAKTNLSKTHCSLKVKYLKK